MNWWTIFGVFIFCNDCAKCYGLGNDFPSVGTRAQKSSRDRPTASSNSLNNDFSIRELLQSEKFSKFDHNLLSELVNENHDKNVVVSPVSMKSLLSLLVEGSTGDTANEILQTLQMQDRQGGVNALRRLQSFIRNDRSSITLKSGNSIYKANDVKVRPEYKTVVKSYYSTDIETVDFSNPDLASNAINQKVNNVTHGLIRSVIEKDTISKDTRLFLLNYVYLKAAWDTAFRPKATRPLCFHTSPDKCQKVKFMYNKRALNYTDSEQLKSEIFEIPFKDPRYRMVFVLPHKGTTVYNVLEKLEHEDVHTTFKQFEENSINLSIPRTVVEFSGNMVGTLKKLGINSAFASNAKLDGMVNTERLSLGHVVHKARIEMNEEGAEAAGVSGANIEFLSLDSDRNVVADRPFLFFIRDVSIAGFLFEGVVFSPDQAR